MSLAPGLGSEIRRCAQNTAAVVVALLLLLSASGCHHRAVPTSVAPQRVDTLWYATVRKRSGARLTYQLADSLEYGFYRMTSRPNVDVMRNRLHLRMIDSGRVTREDFLAAMSAPSPDANGAVILSVHGYAVSHSLAMRAAGEAFLRSGTGARWVVFSWPSSGRRMSLLQPSPYILTNAYHKDSIAADKSSPAFAALLLDLHTQLGGQRLVLVTHSMGAQLTTELMTRDSVVRARLLASPLRAIGLFAPDLPWNRFAEHTVPLLRGVTSRLALYASTNDRMLYFSRWVNRSDRAGLLGKTPRVMDGLETIDVTRGESSEDWLWRHFGAHHAMKRESSALRDFFDIVAAGRMPVCRITNGTAELRADSLWHLLPARARNSLC